jgi:hypothetical protein
MAWERRRLGEGLETNHVKGEIGRSRGDGESVSRRGRVARRGLRACGMGRVRVKPLSDEVWSEESHPLDLSEEEKGEFKVKSYPFI